MIYLPVVCFCARGKICFGSTLLLCVSFAAESFSKDDVNVTSKQRIAVLILFSVFIVFMTFLRLSIFRFFVIWHISYLHVGEGTA